MTYVQPSLLPDPAKDSPTIADRLRNLVSLTKSEPTGIQATTTITAAPEAAPQRYLTEAQRAEIVKANMRGDCDYYPEYTDTIAQSEKKNQFFLTYSGAAHRKLHLLNGNKMTTVTKASTVPGLDVVPDSIDIEIVNKIPGQLLREVVAGFKAVNDQRHTEAAAQIYRRRDDGSYFLYYPKQKVSGASVSYTDDQDAMHNLRTTHILVMELHSHNTMGAFWSGTDNANEEMPGLYGVIGCFGNPKPEMKCRVKYTSLSKDLEPEDIFDTEGIEDLLSFENLPAPSEELLKNIVNDTFGVRTAGGSIRNYRDDLDDDDYWGTGFGSEWGENYRYGYQYASMNNRYRREVDKDAESHSRLFGGASESGKSKHKATRHTGILDPVWLAARLTNDEAEELMKSLLRRPQFKPTVKEQAATQQPEIKRKRGKTK